MVSEFEVFSVFKHREYQKLKEYVDGNVNANMWADTHKHKSLGSGGTPSIHHGDRLFTCIARNMCDSLPSSTAYHQWDKDYVLLCDILTTLKSKGANLEANNGSQPNNDNSRVLSECISRTYNNYRLKSIEFLLKLGANPNGYSHNVILHHVIRPGGKADYDLLILLLQHGLNLNQPIKYTDKQTLTPKALLEHYWKHDLKWAQKEPEMLERNQLNNSHQVKRIIKIKRILDLGWDYVKREMEQKEQRKRDEEQRKKDEEARKIREAEEARLKEEAERERLAAEAEAAAERRRQEAEQRRREAEAERARLAAEAEAERERIRQTAEWQRQEAERVRLAAEAEAERVRQAEERRRQAEERRRLEAQQELERKKTQDNALWDIAVSHSRKCLELADDLPNNFLSFTVDFLETILELFNFPTDSINQSEIGQAIQQFTQLQEREDNVGLDSQSRDRMGGAYFLIGLTNSPKLSQHHEQLPKRFRGYYHNIIQTTFNMANQHISDATKERILKDLNSRT